MPTTDPGRGDEDRQNRQRQNGRNVVDKFTDVDRQRRMEQQQWQEDDQEYGGIDRKLHKRFGDVVKGIGQRCVQEERGQAGNRRSNNRQQDGVGKMQAISGRLSKANEHQKSGDERCKHRDTEHDRTFRHLSGSARGATDPLTLPGGFFPIKCSEF
jgi:hypothetical protein